jgi:ADP-ribose pyrophosphatase YjhB (NUDIX family)
VSESSSRGSLRPRFCPQCGTALITGHDGERERRGCRHCGWIYEPPTSIEVVAVIEHGDGRIVRLRDGRALLPRDRLRWSEAPAAAAVRAAGEATGLDLGAPRFLGFIQSHDPQDPERFVISFCYVLQCEAPSPVLNRDSELVRLRDMPQTAAEPERYALDAYRAWLDRQ